MVSHDALLWTIGVILILCRTHATLNFLSHQPLNSKKPESPTSKSESQKMSMQRYRVEG